MLQAHVGQLLFYLPKSQMKQLKKFKIIDGLATFVFRSDSKGTDEKILADHKCSKKDAKETALREVCLSFLSFMLTNNKFQLSIFS